MLIPLLMVLQQSGTAQDTVCGKNCHCFSRPDYHAPIGVMLDHAHEKGQWMISYRSMYMNMNGNISGTTPVGDNNVFKNYVMSPQNMQMQMHMLMIMYGLTDKITFMGMLNYSVNDMTMSMNQNGMIMNGNNMIMESGTAQMKDHSAGLSDTKLYVLYKLFEKNSHELLLSNGLSLPTGNIALQGTSMNNIQRKTYCMQPGAGTFAYLPGLTYTGNSANFSWGAQTSANINLGVNNFNYSWGNSFTGTVWLSRKWSNWLSNSLRVEETQTQSMYGFDKDIAPYRTTDPTADCKNYGSKKLNAYVGVNFLFPKGKLKGNQLCIEYGMPLYQCVNGLQMKTTQIVNAGWQMTF